MALNVAALSDYVNQNSRDLLTRAITGNDTVDYLKSIGSLYAGIKYKEDIHLLEAAVMLQANASCGRTASGDTTFSSVTLEVKPLADYQNFCQKAFEKKWMTQYLTSGQNYTELLFAKEIMEERASKIANANEKLLWQGDTTSATANLNKFDGILKILDGVATEVSLTGITSPTAQLQKFIESADPAQLESGDFTVFIGRDKAIAYQIELANKNLYREGDPLAVLGTDIKIVPVGGLTGTDKIVAGRASHVVVGTDGTSDAEVATLEFSIETKQFYMDFQYTLGVNVVYADDFLISE